jgi:hypothetical protein
MVTEGRLPRDSSAEARRAKADPFSRATVRIATAIVSAGLLVAVVIAYREVAVLAAGLTAERWARLPVAAALVAVWAASTSRLPTAWTSIGVIWGTILIGLFSIGPRFIPVGLLALVLGSLGVRRPWSFFVSVVSFVAGVTGVCFLNHLYWQSREYSIRSSHFTSFARVDEAPIVRYGSMIFLALLAVLVLIRSFGILDRFRTSQSA